MTDILSVSHFFLTAFLDSFGENLKFTDEN